MSGVYRGTTPGRVYIGTQLAKAVYRGITEIWRRDPAYVDVSASGTHTAPSFAVYADVGVLGAGGGGATGDNGSSTANGEGGNAAVWQYQTITVNPGDVLNFTIGNGGAGATGATKRSGTAGGSSSVTGPGLSLTSSGGSPGIGTTANRDSTGHGASSYTAPNGAEFPGSSDVGADTNGSTPGGGGGGGSYPGWFGTVRPGRNGGNGAGRIRWRSY